MPLDFDQADAQIIAQKLTRHTEIPWPRQTSTPSPQQQSHPMRQGRRQCRVRSSSPIPCAKADGNAESAAAVPNSVFLLWIIRMPRQRGYQKNLNVKIRRGKTQLSLCRKIIAASRTNTTSSDLFFAKTKRNAPRKKARLYL